jgi:hypothetical protein
MRYQAKVDVCGVDGYRYRNPVGKPTRTEAEAWQEAERVALEHFPREDQAERRSLFLGRVRVEPYRFTVTFAGAEFTFDGEAGLTIRRKDFRVARVADFEQARSLLEELAEIKSRRKDTNSRDSRFSESELFEESFGHLFEA